MNGLVLTDNQYRVSEDKLLVMAAKSRDSIKDSNKEKVDSAWKDLMKTEESKSRAELMQHSYANHVNIIIPN